MSNKTVGRPRKLRKVLVVLFLSVSALLSLTFVAYQIEQRLFCRRAELLLSETRSLELRKTPWPEAQAKFEHWKINRRLDPQCDVHMCSMQITLNEFVFGFISETNLFLRLDDYFRWRLKLHYDVGPFVHMEERLLHLYMLAGGHPARVIASIGMRDGTVWSNGFSVSIETYVRQDPENFPYGWSEYMLIASAHSVPRFDYYGGDWPNRQLMIHPNYAIGRPGGCEDCVFGWAEFTPYTDPVDVHRLMQLNLSCLTRWRPCTTQIDIMPAAWAQFLAERPRVNDSWGKVAYSSFVIELLGRDSTNIATGEIIGYHENIDSDGYKQGVAKVRVLELLKGDSGWKVGEVRDVRVFLRPDAPDLKLRSGLRLFLFRGEDRSEPVQIDSGVPCAVIPWNEANLTLVHRGIDQDYSAEENAE